ncbi:hypothetical protein OPV22_023765 [Ensete ventricosum]|uniref:Uncharacterized protein n=1 Tax=Ensete ventricosum TaxID=4639 RepID=A0AAV8QST0_ENSVE|nr:hypothetical protein OPV22_023765 [Ensete ventricosum]
MGGQAVNSQDSCWLCILLWGIGWPFLLLLLLRFHHEEPGFNRQGQNSEHVSYHMDHAKHCCKVAELVFWQLNESSAFQLGPGFLLQTSSMHHDKRGVKASFPKHKFLLVLRLPSRTEHCESE